MEFILSLSMIVLVGMLAALILAVSAYVLYQARERRRLDAAALPAAAAAVVTLPDAERLRPDSSLQPPAAGIVAEKPAVPDEDRGESVEATARGDASAASVATADASAARQPTAGGSAAGASAAGESAAEPSAAFGSAANAPAAGAAATNALSDQVASEAPEAAGPRPTPCLVIVPAGGFSAPADLAPHRSCLPPAAEDPEISIPVSTSDPGARLTIPAHEKTIIFWEYTGEGFVPVDPTNGPSSAPIRRSRVSRGTRDDEGVDWL